MKMSLKVEDVVIITRENSHKSVAPTRRIGNLETKPCQYEESIILSITLRAVFGSQKVIWISICCVIPGVMDKDVR
jgi:hypothetical protein